jgi:glutamine amidotransferase
MASIGVVDYGMGNLHSLGKALERVSAPARVEISYDPKVLVKCDRLVLPGVGGVRGCVDELRRLELIEVLRLEARKKPLMGICLGMQVLLEHSEENGGVDGLGLFPGAVRRFPEAQPGPDGTRLKVPHMGWNQVHQPMAHPIWKGIADNSWFYFVHSYRAVTPTREHVLGETDYLGTFPSALAHENVVAFQFHPEKSQAAGITLLSNFVSWQP